jgi:hypothetical protein
MFCTATRTYRLIVTDRALEPISSTRRFFFHGPQGALVAFIG